MPVLLPGVLAPLILVCLVTLEQFELPSIIGVPAKVNIFSYRILYELTPPTACRTTAARRQWPCRSWCSASSCWLPTISPSGAPRGL